MTLKEFLIKNKEHLLDVKNLTTDEALCCGVEDYLNNSYYSDKFDIPLSSLVETKGSLLAYALGFQFEILIPPEPDRD